VPTQACAHACRQREGFFRAWPFIAVVIASCFCAHKNPFLMRWPGSSRRHLERATQGCDSRPKRLTRLPGLLCPSRRSPTKRSFWSAACQSAGSKSAFALPARFVRGESAFPVREHDVAR
jgi:hypothetical protein